MEAKIPDLVDRLGPAIAQEEALLGEQGRVLIRESGTEPLVRVMVEATDTQVAEESAARLVEAVAAL